MAAKVKLIGKRKIIKKVFHKGEGLKPAGGEKMY